MTATMRFFEARNCLAADIAAGLIAPTIEAIASAFEVRGGYAPYEAACNAEKFLADLQRGVERQTARPKQ
jgi:hypothetical protein